MMPKLRDLGVSFLLGAPAYVFFCMTFSLAALLVNGYAPKYLKLRVMPQFRFPKALAAAVGWLLDLCAVLFASLMLILYDCGVLGGGMRLQHFFCFLLGVLFVRFIEKRFLRKILSPVLALAFEAALLLFGIFVYPIQAAFSLVFWFYRRFLLICHKKYDKIRENRSIKRYTERQISLAKEAFLPHDPAV